MDKVLAAKLRELRKVLLIMATPEEMPTNEELDLTNRGREQIANGDRIRIGKNRALYKVVDDVLVMMVFNIDSRGDVYKRV